MNDKLDVEVVFPASMEYVPSIREFIRESLYTKDYSEKEAFRTEIMVDELMSNSVIYGSSGISDKIKLNFSFDSDKFECIVEDYGVNPEHKKRLEQVYKSLNDDKDIDGIKKGLSLVKLISDDISLDISKDGDTEIKVTKYKNRRDIENE